MFLKFVLFYILFHGYLEYAHGCVNIGFEKCSCAYVTYDLKYELVICSRSNKTDTGLSFFNKVYKSMIARTNRTFGVAVNEKSLQNIPNKTFDGMAIVHLDLSQNSIASVEKCSFYGLKFLKGLILSQNNLKMVYLSDLMSLQVLNLDNNQLAHLTTETITNLPELVVLSIASNQLSFIQENFFAKMEKLKILFLNRNEIRFWNKLGLSVKLESLNLSFNQIQMIEKDAFTGLRNLKILKFSLNKINYLDSMIFSDLESLDLLQLNNLNLEAIYSNTFIGLSNVTQLILEYNLLTTIADKTFQNLSRFKLLTLNNNNIDLIEAEAFTGLSKLEELYLYNNQITILQKSMFSSHCNLSILHLSSNRIKILRENVFPSCSFDFNVLELGFNKIEFIKRYHFRALVNLKHLYLDNNPISVIEAKSFDTLKSLSYLKMQDNCIFHLDRNLFSGLEKLSYVNIENNVISVFETKIFVNSNLSSKYLSLNNNLISYLDFIIFEFFEVGTVQLELQNNFLLELDGKINSNILQSISSLNLNNNKNFKAKNMFKESSLVRLPKLKSLYLSRNSMEVIERFDLRNVQDLDLSYTVLNIKIMRSIPFSELQRLNLSYATLNGGQKGNMFIERVTNENLIELKLANDIFSIDAVRRYLKDSTELSLLWLVEMQISNLRRLLSRFTQLENLNLTNNKITIISSDDFYDKIFLKYLCLKNNKISLIEEDAFSEMPNLVFLDLSFNLLKIISEEIFGLNILAPSMFFLCDNNLLESVDFLRLFDEDYLISNDFFDYFDYVSSALYYNIKIVTDFSFSLVNLAENNLKTTPTRLTQSFKRTSEMHVVNLNKNLIQSLTIQVKDAFTTWIKYLFFSRNQISFIEDFAFSNMPILQKLDLSQNKISNLTSQSFSGLKELESLNLSYNFISILSGVLVFEELTNLIQLDLRANNIHTIGDNYLRKLINLRRLYLSENPVRSIFLNEALNGLKSLKNLYISSSELYFSYEIIIRVIDRFKAKILDKSVGNITYLDPVFITYLPIRSDYMYSDQECFYIQHLSKHNILLNLENDEQFLEKCQGWANSQIKMFFQK